MPQGTEEQERLLSALRARDPQIKVTWHREAPMVVHLSGALTEPSQAAPRDIARAFLLEYQALFGIEAAQIDLAEPHLSTDRFGGQHVTFQQRVGAVPVWSSVVQVHMSSQGQVRTVKSSYRPEAQVDPQPTIDWQQALEIAAKDAGVAPEASNQKPNTTVYVFNGQPHLAWVLTTAAGKPTGTRLSTAPILWAYFIDAHDGQIINRVNMIHAHLAPTGEGESVSNPPALTQTTKTFPVTHTHGPDSYCLEDTTRHIQMYDVDGAVPDWSPGQNGFITGHPCEDPDNDWDDTTGMTSTDPNQRIQCQAAEVDAFDHLARIYDYYQAKFGRDSLNDAGMPIDAYVHACTYDDDGNVIAWNNAYWNPAREHILFGDGQYDGIDGPWGDKTFYSGALDVVAHEYTHGVTNYELLSPWGTPWGFIYEGEPGATSEAFADILAAFIEGDWKQGDKTVVLGPGETLWTPGKMWRDLANPTRGLAYDPNDSMAEFLAKGVPQPDHYEDRYQGPIDEYHDWGGVHINSGILNYACYLATHGGISHRAGRIPEDIRVYRKDRLGIGVEHAEQIFYQALTEHFTGNYDATFSEVREEVLDACTGLRVDHQYGIDQCDWNTLNTAFYAVGLQPVGETYGPDPMITPCGRFTDVGPLYQSIDIWCEDAGGAQVNAQKGIVNRLVARVHNIGDQPAQEVIVRFSYTPYGLGYTGTDFMRIIDQAVNLAAGETRAVAVDWDLTDLTIDNGGRWPEPVGSFDHFCVQVELITGDGNDINTCNNLAQSNFVNVLPHQAGVPETLIIANPDPRHTIELHLRVEKTLPRDWKLLLDEKPLPPVITLRPGEKRVAKLRIDIPADEPILDAPYNGRLKAKLSGSAAGEIDGWIEDFKLVGRPPKLQGRIQGLYQGDKPGRFEGTVDIKIVNKKTGEVEGDLTATIQELDSHRPNTLKGAIHGYLRPTRRLSLGGFIGDEGVGGIDIDIVEKD